MRLLLLDLLHIVVLDNYTAAVVQVTRFLSVRCRILGHSGEFMLVSLSVFFAPTCGVANRSSRRIRPKVHGRFGLLSYGYAAEIIVHRVIGFLNGRRGWSWVIFVRWLFLAISYQDDTIFIFL